VVLDPRGCLTAQGEAGRDCTDLGASREPSEVLIYLYIISYTHGADHCDSRLYIPSSKSPRSTNVY
jgi:hypothetical protein